jgi:hypothetical protein
MKSIFIQIPSYRDLELPKTIQDCIDMSSGQVHLHIGVHNCFLLEDEVDFVYPTAPHVRISHLESRAPENIGLQLSRKLANDFYDGETYYFQIDSHTRFMRNWDKSLIETIELYKSVGISKPLITQYPATYEYTEEMVERFSPSRDVENKNYYPTRISFHENVENFAITRIPSQTAMSVDQWCSFTASISGGFVFVDGEFSEITPNPKIAFWGEEPLIAARAFTHGFDLVTPFHDTIWHLYASGRPFEYVRRHHAWKDFPELWPEIDRQSKAEYFRIMTEAEVGPYALGSARTLREYEEFAGLDFKTGKVTQIDLRKLY